MVSRFPLIFSLVLLVFAASSRSQDGPPEVIYDEAAVPAYTLPDPLRFGDGTPVASAADWQRRRAELMELFATHVYGKTPVGRPAAMRFEPRRKISDFLDGKASLEEIRIHFSTEESGPFLDLILIKPNQIPEGGVPTFLTLNFAGNHTLHPSPEITLSTAWIRSSAEDKEQGLVLDNRATEKARGSRVSRWPVEKLIDAGTALASFYYGDIDPDFDDGFRNGIHALFGEPRADEWGSIGAWAWGASRAMDYLETDKTIDRKRIAIFGHSRLGKTSLWAGAQDDAVRPRHLEQFRVRRCRPEPPVLRRAGRTHQHRLPPLVLRHLCKV